MKLPYRCFLLLCLLSAFTSKSFAQSATDKIWKNVLIQHRQHKIDFTADLIQEKTATANKLLDSAYTIITSATSDINPVWSKSTKRNLLLRFIDFFSGQRQMDSARYYLALLRDLQDSTNTEPSDGTAYLLSYSRFKAPEGYYKEAYEKNDSIIAAKTADINNNMYAQTVAESSWAQAKRTQEEKQERNIVISIISVLLLGSVTALLLRLKTKEKNNRKRVEQLDQTKQLQIAELEIRAHMIQKKLGMELHDDLAGNIAHLCNLIEKEQLEPDLQAAQQRMKKIAETAREAYQKIRSKSHSWYADGLESTQLSFSANVHKIVHHALSQADYEKQIEVDDQSLTLVPFALKIEMLRIIQEAVINILKHAKADKVTVFIYYDEGFVNLQIKDNGVGFTRNHEKHKGIGLQSIRSRVEDLGGTVNVVTTHRKGAEIQITIPV